MAPKKVSKKNAFIAVGFLIALTAIVIVARLLRSSPEIEEFITQFPGALPVPEKAQGIPAWLAWQHFLNLFFILFIIRTGWIIRSKKRPPAFWTRNNTGLIRSTNPPRRMGIYHWLHLVVDGLWALNGVVFVILLCATDQWLRIVPTTWEVFPNAASALFQYLSFDWPTDSVWTSYNSLQVLAYFTTVFIAAPLAIATGLRLSPVWPTSGVLQKAFSEHITRKTHAAVMFYFLLFIVVHVFLVLATHTLQNLNAIFTARDSSDLVGLFVFAGVLLILTVSWILATPQTLKKLASYSGKVVG